MNWQKNSQDGTQPVSFQGIIALVDTNNDKQIQATELRQIIQTLTQSYFAAADTNRRGQMSPSEVNAAVAGIARSIAQQTFQQADTDRNGQLSRAVVGVGGMAGHHDTRGPEHVQADRISVPMLPGLDGRSKARARKSAGVAMRA